VRSPLGLDRRAAALLGVAAASAVLAACGPGLPASVVEGSTVTVGWTNELTSLNAATTTGGTEGNHAVSQATHDAFARVVEGDVVVDESFGTVEVVDPAPTSFTVRYDLAERDWSDGVPIDAADLLLAWAAGSGATVAQFNSPASDLAQSATVPAIDQSERRIDVTFAAPVRGWQTDLDVAVPAHVVGQRALGIDDPMEAKQAVIDAIVDGDATDLASIAEVWSSGFVLDTGTDDVPDDLAVASGPYRVTGIDRSGSGADHVTLEANRSYGGDAPPTYERLELVAAGSGLSKFPNEVDIVQLAPTPDNFVPVRDQERRDQQVVTTYDGRLWVLALRADRGVFRAPDARLAFLRAVPRTDLRDAAAGDWSEAYAASTSLLFLPGSRGDLVSIEDAGFTAQFENPEIDPATDRSQAGVPRGTPVCLLYDTGDPFSRAVFEALPALVRESGWSITDCGRTRVDDALTATDWQAVLTTVTLPSTPQDITDTWGGTQASPLTGAGNPEREDLVAELARTPDPYEAVDIGVAIERGLILDAVAMPIAVDPVVTLASSDVEGVFPGSGPGVSLLLAASTWAPES
jgi:peptide/nickel transport system substrate-binding protein